MAKPKTAKRTVETRGAITINAGKITKNGRLIGTVMHELQHGYHPVVRLRLDGQPVKTFEIDTPDLIGEVFALAESV